MQKERKLRRVVGGSNWFGGVCGGIAYYFGVHVWLVRLVCAILALCTGFVWTVPYVLLWALLPAWEPTPSDFHQVTGD